MMEEFKWAVVAKNEWWKLDIVIDTFLALSAGHESEEKNQLSKGSVLSSQQ